jgi:DNA-binding XRE family transcriptional regulator
LLIRNTSFSLTRPQRDHQLPPAGVHNRLSVLRADRGLSRQQLADALDINYQTVGFLERGDYAPSLELAMRISQLFHVPVEAIFSLQPFKPLTEELYGRSPQEATKR